MFVEGSNGGGAYLDPTACANLIQGATLNITNSRYIVVSGLAVALYDIFLLLADEVWHVVLLNRGYQAHLGLGQASMGMWI
jgi:hypothetical protein